MLDNRETAAFIWLGIAALSGFSSRTVRTSLGHLLRSLFRPVILIPLAAMLAYVSLEIWIGSRLSLWNGDLGKGTLIWLAGSALVLCYNSMKSGASPDFFRRTVVGTIGVMVFVEFFLNLYVMSLVIELILQPVLTFLVLLSAFAAVKAEHRPVKRLVDAILAVGGLLLVVYAAIALYRNWREIDEMSLVLEFALPIWLTIGLLPFIYALGLYARYDFAIRGVNWATAESQSRWRTYLALVTSFGFRLQELHGFNWNWTRQLAEAPTLKAGREVVADYRRQRREAEKAIAEEEERLRRYAGSDETDGEGRRLDRREFKATCEALRWVATSQMGWYRSQGGRYKKDLLVVFGDSLTSLGLPPEHGITLLVAPDGQAWYAWRRTITGWCFGIGAGGAPPNQWEYDGPEPPTGFPGQDPTWGQSPYSDEVSLNWS